MKKKKVLKIQGIHSIEKKKGFENQGDWIRLVEDKDSKERSKYSTEKIPEISVYFPYLFTPIYLP